MKIYDVVLTLGNGLTKDFKVPPIIASRLHFVASLYKKGIANKILVSGRYSIGWDVKGIHVPTTEAKEMKIILLKVGIRDKDILVEEKSKDTIGNLYFSKIFFLKPLLLNRILLVCADVHLHRVSFLAKKILGKSFTIDYQITTTKSSKDKKFISMQKSVLEMQKAFLRNMKDGDDAFLAKRLYTDPYYLVKRADEVILSAMKGIK